MWSSAVWFAGSVHWMRIQSMGLNSLLKIFWFLFTTHFDTGLLIEGSLKKFIQKSYQILWSIVQDFFEQFLLKLKLRWIAPAIHNHCYFFGLHRPVPPTLCFAYDLGIETFFFVWQMKISFFQSVPFCFKSSDFPDPLLKVLKCLSLRCKRVLNQMVKIMNPDWSKCKPQKEVLIDRWLFFYVLIWFVLKRLAFNLLDDIFQRSLATKVSANSG